MKIIFTALSLILLSNISLYAVQPQSSSDGTYPNNHSQNMTTHLSNYSAWFKKVSRGQKKSLCRHQMLTYNRYYVYAKQRYVQPGGKCQFCAKIIFDKNWYPINAFGQIGVKFLKKHHTSNGQNQSAAKP